MRMSKTESRRAMLAFLKYARYGFDERALYAFDMVDNIRGCVRNKRDAREMLAVCDTIRFLSCTGRKEILRALRAIYFAGDGRMLRRNELSLRVRRYATENYYDERTVYRHLTVAKRLFLSVLEEP